MPSFQFDIGNRSRTVGRFIGHVRSELQRAFLVEKATRKLSFQGLASLLNINRSVVHRQIMGVENMTLRSVAELAWAMGWEPAFSLKKQQTTGNYFIATTGIIAPQVRSRTETSNTSMLAA